MRLADLTRDIEAHVKGNRPCQERSEALIEKFKEFREGFVFWLSEFCERSAKAGLAGIEKPGPNLREKGGICQKLTLNSLSLYLVSPDLAHSLKPDDSRLAAKLFLYPRTRDGHEGLDDDNKPYAEVVLLEDGDGGYKFYVARTTSRGVFPLSQETECSSYGDDGQLAAKTIASFVCKADVAWKERPLLKSVFGFPSESSEIRGYAGGITTADQEQ